METDVIKERMEELGIDLNDLVRRYCQVKHKKGDLKAKPVNRRNMLSKALNGESKPSLETYLDMIAALDGEMLVQWKDVKVRRVDVRPEKD